MAPFITKKSLPPHPIPNKTPKKMNKTPKKRDDIRGSTYKKSLTTTAHFPVQKIQKGMRKLRNFKSNQNNKTVQNTHLNVIGDYTNKNSIKDSAMLKMKLQRKKTGPANSGKHAQSVCQSLRGSTFKAFNSKLNQHRGGSPGLHSPNNRACKESNPELLDPKMLFNKAKSSVLKEAETKLKASKQPANNILSSRQIQTMLLKNHDFTTSKTIGPRASNDKVAQNLKESSQKLFKEKTKDAHPKHLQQTMTDTQSSQPWTTALHQKQLSQGLKHPLRTRQNPENKPSRPNVLRASMQKREMSSGQKHLALSTSSSQRKIMNGNLGNVKVQTNPFSIKDAGGYQHAFSSRVIPARRSMIPVPDQPKRVLSPEPKFRNRVTAGPMLHSDRASPKKIVKIHCQVNTETKISNLFSEKGGYHAVCFRAPSSFICSKSYEKVILVENGVLIFQKDYPLCKL